jgi:hypothetical protein
MKYKTRAAVDEESPTRSDPFCIFIKKGVHISAACREMDDALSQRPQTLPKQNLIFAARSSVLFGSGEIVHNSRAKKYFNLLPTI